MDLKNGLEAINEIIILPVAVISFILLIKVAMFLRTKDPDVVRAKIFLKFRIFRKALVFTAFFSFVLVIHISLIYVRRFYNSIFGLPVADIQRFFGLVLVFTLISFVYFIYRSIK
jgi:hypothetical protein